MGEVVKGAVQVNASAESDVTGSPQANKTGVAERGPPQCPLAPPARVNALTPTPLYGLRRHFPLQAYVSNAVAEARYCMLSASNQNLLLCWSTAICCTPALNRAHGHRQVVLRI